MVVNFHEENYFGENMVIVGTGCIHHDHLVDLAEKNFGHVRKTAPNKIMNMEQCNFNNGLLCVRDEEIDVSNVGVFYNAPSWKDPDFYGFLLLQRIFGEFSNDLHGTEVLDV